MEQDVAEPHGAGRADVKLPVAAAAAQTQAAASSDGGEEQAAQDAQLKPERESKMSDYFVRQPVCTTAFPSPLFARN